MVIEHYTMDDVDVDTLRAYRMRFQNENGEHIWNTYDDTPLNKAVRESCVNMIIHADYMMEGTLKVIKTAEGFEITNPGVLKIPKEQIFGGGNSKARNPRMQPMLCMVGYGDNAGSGFPTILNAWEEQGWDTPELIGNTILNQVTLILKMKQEKAKSSNIAQKVGVKEPFQLFYDRDTKKYRRNLS